jgi:hypothetical protein
MMSDQEPVKCRTCGVRAQVDEMEMCRTCWLAEEAALESLLHQLDEQFQATEDCRERAEDALFHAWAKKLGSH